MKSRVLDGVELRELTVAEIYDWLSELLADENRPEPEVIDPKRMVNRTVLPDATLDDLARMTSLTVAQMAHFPPGSLELLARECRELNSHFFRLAAGVKTGTFPPLQTQALPESATASSAKPSSPSPVAATPA